jgi:hypothetical protein
VGKISGVTGNTWRGSRVEMWRFIQFNAERVDSSIV